MKNNIANIGPKDSLNEKLFKMIEQVKHVNSKLSDFLKQEDSMSKLVKEFNHMPAIFKSFEEIPSKLEQEVQMLQTIDMQLKEVQKQFTEVSAKAMDIAGQNQSAIPQGQVLALPKDLVNTLLDIGVDLRNVIEAT